jgi:hypothetical protein
VPCPPALRPPSSLQQSELLTLLAQQSRAPRQVASCSPRNGKQVLGFDWKTGIQLPSPTHSRYVSPCRANLMRPIRPSYSGHSSP